MLLDHHAYVDCLDAALRTPLHLATINGSVAICQMLLRRGADHRADGGL